LQYQFGGPCVDATLETVDQVHADDLSTEARWPEFTAAALAETPVRSMLSSRLYISAEEPFGALNLYAHTPRAFDADAARTARVLVAHVAPALALVRERDKTAHLQRALESSREIGVAIGVLMTRHNVTREQAFDMLRVASQHSQRKLFDIAAEVGDTGTLPKTPRSRRHDPARVTRTPRDPTAGDQRS
jgi:ANTAR domain-containing protein